MRVYVVVGYQPSEFAAVEGALARFYEGATYKLRDGLWFIRTNESTSKEVSDRLGITPTGELSNGLVIGMSGYFGRWRPDAWEWLNTIPGGFNG